MKKFLIISLIILVIASAGAVVAMKVMNDNHEHAYGEWETKTPATCTEAEVEVRRCECNEEETREGDAPLGHKYTSVVTAPTCTEAGYTTYTCDCGHSYKDDEVAATGHSFVNEVAEEKYLASNNCGEQPTYFKSCSCGEKGSETFAYGEVNGHVYSSVITAPTCTAGGYTTYTCDCGHSYVADEKTKLGHNMVSAFDDAYHWTECDREGCDEATEKVAHSVASISAVCNIENPMDTMVVKAKDLTVTANCDCGHHSTVTEGIELENATLALGENTVTVKYGELSTALTITAAELDVALDGTITDNTYVSSSSKTADKSKEDELKGYSDAFRVYFRVNIKDAINNELFDASKAKVQLTLTIINEGTNQNNLIYNDEIMDKVYTLKAYADTGVAFSNINWNSVSGTDLHWGSGKGLVSNEAGSNITVADGKITITVAYIHLADCVDENGNIILAFASQNAKSISVGSISNEGMEPAVKVLLNEDTVHVFDQENADEKYFASAKCTEQAKYYKSCSCGEMCFVTFNYGDVIDHEFGDWTTTKEATCTEAGKETRACANCIKTETQTIDALDHDMKIASDDSYHWEECDREGCDEKTEGGAHFGGTATEEKQAECEICGKEYGGLDSHVHDYIADVTPPTCTEDGYTTYTCSCKHSYVEAGAEATGHTMVDGACSSCGHTEKTEVTVAGTIVQDTYINSKNEEIKGTSFSNAEELYAQNSNNYRPLFKFNLASVLNDAKFNKDTAKVSFTFVVSTGATNLEAATYNIYGFLPGEGVSDVDFANVTWSTNSKDGTYSKLYRNTANSNCEFLKKDTAYADMQDIVSITTDNEVTYITYTLNYSDIEKFVCVDEGATYGYLVMGFDFNKSIRFASMENTTYAAPAVSVTYTK